MTQESSNSPRATPHSTAWLLVVTAAFALLFPQMLRRGMFIDGILYGAIARNMAVGIGDTWHPTLNPSMFAEFHEHPPLALLLESILFRLLGDQWWVERLYSSLTAVVTGLALMMTWRWLFRDRPELKAWAWLPIVLWISVTKWAATCNSNLLENTLGVFTTLSVYASLRAMRDGCSWPTWCMAAAAALAAAALSKGPVGLFPLVTPSIFWFAMRRSDEPSAFRKALCVQFALLLLTGVFLGLVLLHQDAREYLATYMNEQVFASLQGTRETRHSSIGHAYILWRLSEQIILPFALGLAAIVMARRRGLATKLDDRLRGHMVFALLTALSASLPIVISPKQSAAYTAASWPFFALAIALWSLPATRELISRVACAPGLHRKLRRVRYCAAGVIAITTAVACGWAGGSCRDRQLIHDVDHIGQRTGRHAVLSVPQELPNDGTLHFYLYRWYYIQLSKAGTAREYRLEPMDAARQPPPSYTLADSELVGYRLWKCPSIAAAQSPSRQAQRCVCDQRPALAE
jgi:4-amino-4-deoxy-L-arabinose transferase-like glycosyltransferase